MKKKFVVLIALAFVISNVIAFAIGSIRGSDIRQKQAEQVIEEANIQTELVHYSNYRDIALDIKAGSYVDAQCLAEMAATSMLIPIEKCTENEQCRNSLDKNARQLAPEILGSATVLIEKRNKCSRTNK